MTMLKEIIDFVSPAFPYIASVIGSIIFIFAVVIVLDLKIDVDEDDE